MNIIISVYRHILVVLFSLYCICLQSASASIASSSLDDIGSKYTLDKNNDPFVTVTINNELEVSFSVKTVGDKGDLAFIYTSDPANGVGSLICRVTSTCRGKQLSAALESFINAIYNFNSNQSRMLGSKTDSGVSGNQTKTASKFFDVNTVPAQHRNSESKVKAWMKQEGYFGKQMSFLATVSMVADSTLFFKCNYDEEQMSLFGSFSFQATPANYSPLDYNENDIYEVSGILGANILGALIVDNPVIKPSAHTEASSSNSSSSLSAQDIENGRSVCINNMRLIDAAKEQYSLAMNITNNVNISTDNITEYLRGHMLPTCPNGGNYVIGPYNTNPSCSVHGALKSAR